MRSHLSTAVYRQAGSPIDFGTCVSFFVVLLRVPPPPPPKCIYKFRCRECVEESENEGKYLTPRNQNWGGFVGVMKETKRNLLAGGSFVPTYCSAHGCENYASCLCAPPPRRPLVFCGPSWPQRVRYMHSCALFMHTQPDDAKLHLESLVVFP